MEPLKESWSLISTSANDKIGPEALEALIDTTVLFTAVTKSACTISDINSQMLLRLFSHPNLDEEHVRPALAVAVTFWGLSLDNWSSFWEPSERKRNWREIFTRPEPRKKHQAALFLLGLSRFLEHSTTLRLDHTSIQTIATEINRYMQQSNVSEARLTLPFLPAGFDVRRHVREVVASYLRETENQAPFPKSVATSRSQLLSAIQLDGGEGFQYEVPQPFARNNRQEASTSSSV
ncbi:hypothetical protein FRC09_005793 [Ceratobasidium sp. 395]|nr:hypothetical protein FRC09_005793 [Ceratobasidium sp. 395]